MAKKLAADLGSWAPSDVMNRSLAEEHNGQCILSFSGGKDSIGAWLALRAAGFDDITPVYLYLVPGLQFIERQLAYYEDVFDTRIIRLPNPNLHKLLNDGALQLPGHLYDIDRADLMEHDYDGIFDAIRQDCSLGSGCMAALGVRAADSPNRWATIKQRGPVNLTRRTWFPIFDWTADRLREVILASKVVLPMDYRIFGCRSFDGLDARFMVPLRDVFPEDYARVREWFPLIDAVVMRHEFFWPEAIRGLRSLIVPDHGQTPPVPAWKAEPARRTPRRPSSR
jgi:hypothetical protein